MMGGLFWPFVVLRNEDARGRELADRHYSRRTVGARGFMPPGRRFALWRPGVLWCVVWNLDPLGTPRWRNTLFRNELGVRSSHLIRLAWAETCRVWVERYGALPAERLTTEVDVDATAARRSRSALPGRCYEAAGWEFLGIRQRAKRRIRHAIWAAPVLS